MSETMLAWAERTRSRVQKMRRRATKIEDKIRYGARAAELNRVIDWIKTHDAQNERHICVHGDDNEQCARHYGYANAQTEEPR